MHGQAEALRTSASPLLVAEADESDGTFLHLTPTVAIVTNIDADHMSTYDGDIEKLKSGFIEFLHNLPFYGLAVVCKDDPGVNEILGSIGRSVVTYGTSEDADVRAENIEFCENHTHFDVVRAGEREPLRVELRDGPFQLFEQLRYIVVDEASTNGTFVGPVRLPPHTPRIVRSGDLIRLGRIIRGLFLK